MLKIKIQQLKKENFVVTISGKDLITDLKEKILAILKATQVEEVDHLNIANLRLIYKGKVLLDPKSLEFYKIQSDDTIQLCPIRRNVWEDIPNGQVSGSSLDIDNEDEDDNVREESGPISFFLDQHPGLGNMRQLHGHSASRNRRVLNGNNHLTQVASSRPRESSSRNRTTPEAFTEKLQSLRSALEDSLCQVNSVNMENREDLVPHLDTLIRQARNLRDDLAPEQQEQPSVPVVEIHIFVRASAAWDLGSDLEEIQERGTESNGMDNDNAGVMAPLSARREGGQNSTILSSSRVVEERERPNIRRSSRLRNIFSNIINRFSRRG